MRRWLSFDVEGSHCVATLDEADGTHGLLIVSGGNEIRAGAHRGMATLAQAVAEAGHPVLRFDRRGIGDSEGENQGFEGSGPDIAAALAAFRAACPTMARITAFGNCDAASALILHHQAGGPNALLLANPWTIEAGETSDTAPLPPAQAIRRRYIAKLSSPAEISRLLTGRINLSKLWRGLLAAAVPPTHNGALAARIATALAAMPVPTTVLIAEGDRTAQAFLEHWHSAAWANIRARGTLCRHPTASHGFADDDATAWLHARVLAALRS